jgi:hypothetical protein
MPVILATQEAEIRRFLLKATPGKHFTKPSLTDLLVVVVYACYPWLQKVEIRRITVPG